MTRGCKVAALAAAVAIGLSTSAFVSPARAGAFSGDAFSLAPDNASNPVYLDDATSQPATPPPPDRPLAALLKKEGVNTGDIAIYGFVEGSYTYSASSPPDNMISGRAFDIDNEEVILNQIDLSIEKTVDQTAAAKDNKWIVGGKFEMIYGNDARFVHANGLNFYGSSTPQLDPENQFDLVQAYVDVGIPIGNGLLVRAGKFVTLLGEETINPTTNAFYSHSYLFAFAIPFTHTGVLGKYVLNDKWTVTAGFTRGWDQALEDNNDVIDWTGSVAYTISPEWSATFNFITGPEQTNNDSLYTTVFDGILAYAPANSKWSFAANGDYGWAPGTGAAGGDGTWYGVAGYAGYKINDTTTANARLEWFDDPDGARGIGTDVYEATLGLAIKPWPGDLGQNLTIRPEIRFDYADQAFFDGGTDHYQWTAAVDAIFTY